MTTNSNSYLKVAGTLIKGDLADVNSELKAGREKRQGILWRVLTHLVCYANNEVFAQGYTKKLASQFRADVMSETGLSEKQAGKYTEHISAALGVRGVRKSVRSLEGLDVAAKDGVKAVEDYLKGAEIETFGQFMSAVKIDPSPVAKVATALAKLTIPQRALAMEQATKIDKDEAADSAN